MYIYQPSRILLKQQIKKQSHYIKGKVLDIGAGDFSRYESFFDCKEYIKMDIEKNNNVDVVGRAEKIPFEDGSFDSVICTQVFEHLDKPFEAAKEIGRVLKKGGICLLTIPQVNELHEEPVDYFRYTKYGMKKVFSQFKLINSSQRGGFFTLKAQLNIRYLIDRFHLYNHKFLGRVLSKFFQAYSELMYFIDKLDKSEANRKNTIGWCFVFKKI